jgi:hypothetical protein
MRCDDRNASFTGTRQIDRWGHEFDACCGTDGRDAVVRVHKSRVEEARGEGCCRDCEKATVLRRTTSIYRTAYLGKSLFYNNVRK